MNLDADPTLHTEVLWMLYGFVCAGFTQDEGVNPFGACP